MPCFLRKSVPKMQGHTKFLQTMKSFLYSFDPILNSHSVIPIGQRLVPLADFMLQLCMVRVTGIISLAHTAFHGSHIYQDITLGLTKSSGNGCSDGTSHSYQIYKEISSPVFWFWQVNFRFVTLFKSDGWFNFRLQPVFYFFLRTIYFH